MNFMKKALGLLESFKGTRLALAVILFAGAAHQMGEASLETAIIIASGGALYGTWVTFKDCSESVEAPPS